MILVSFNFSDIKENSVFLKKWGGAKAKGGIYIIEYIHNTSIYYIELLYLKEELIIILKRILRVNYMLKLVGLEHKRFSIIETCSVPSEQGKRENYYLQNFLPILNTTFSSFQNLLYI